MAKKVSENEITNITQDWGYDESNGLPYSGKAVQDFIKKEGITKAQTAYGERIGATYFNSTDMTLYAFKNEEDKSAWMDSGDSSLVVTTTPFNFSGTVNQLKITSDIDGNSLYFTSGSGKAEITVGFLSQEKGITDTSWNDVFEDAMFSVSVDRGATGAYTEILSNQRVSNGDTITFDVFKYIASGNNRVKITATGTDTGTVGNLVYNVTLTSMYLSPSNFAWNVPFIEGNTYNLGGLNIGGNIDKRLYIKVSNDVNYSKTYEVNIGTNTYINVSYYYDGIEFPTDGTGIYNLDIWLDANGLESEHLYYNIICVSQTDKSTARLVAISDTPSVVKNFATNKLFSYVVYNGGSMTASPTVNVKSIVNNITNVLVSETLGNVPTATINDYIIDVEIDSQEPNIALSASIEFGNEQEAIYRIDNSASYPAVSGAVFYLNPTNRNNSQSNREVIVNESNIANAPSEYIATWENVSFVDGMDGWTVDDDGRKCLAIPAGSKVTIDYKPMSGANTRSIEIAMKVRNAADYDEDIITVATTALSDFVGFKIKPTNVLLHSNLLRTSDYTQSYNLKDEEFVHILITIVQNYKQIGNLAQIYVNGIKKCSFEWSTSDSFSNESKLVLGSETADLYVYKMRVYNSSFEWAAAVQNFISCLSDTSSKTNAYNMMMSVINDGYKIDYDKIKGKKNTFVVELPSGQSIPSKLNDTAVEGTTLTVDIVDNPDATINGVFEDATTEGQGTTAMTYFRWNFRWKTDDIRITAKKNVASSMQDHKMGATGLFNDLNMAIVGANEANGRVAVYQYPAYGFQKILVEGTTDQYIYEYIGIYTIGPDKGDKPTFGFDNKTYKSTLIHMEGVDHTPQGVGMDYPWSQLGYSASVEALGALKADGSVNPAWEVGACAGLSPDESGDEGAIMSYLTQELKPAYDCDYLNTNMIVGLEKGTSIDDVNADLNNFRATLADNGFTYADHLIWIDGEYDTYYYNIAQSKYVKDGVNILTDLGITASDLTGTTVKEKNNEIIELRKARYRSTMENYWHLRDNLFHYCFILLLGATDNYKKNTYPYKFGTLASGSRWRWRSDDLDTLFDINNLGIADKSYSIMDGDKNGDSQIYKGNSSYHWRNIEAYYPSETKDMMLEILAKMAEFCPSGYGTSPIQKVIGCIRHYFWDKAQNYFPTSAYNIDAEWTYEDAWAVYKTDTSVNAVHPLSQSLGSHEEAERAWVELRAVYMASMYGFGAFNDYKDITLGQLNFRPSGDNTFNIVPAIDMNPTIVSGQGNIISSGERIMAGETAPVTVAASASADTIICVQATDYIQDLGDMKDVKVNAANPTFAISGKRLQRIKVGDEDASKVTTNLTNLTVGSCPSVSVVDARNVNGLTGTVDLSQCPRLRQALFGGSSADEVVLPKGSKITLFDLPNTLKNLSLVDLPNLKSNTYRKYEAELEYTGRYYATNQGVGNVCNYSVTVDANVAGGVVINLEQVQSITVTGKGGDTPRLWCFLDANDIILSCAEAQASATGLELTIPSNAVKCIVQFMSGTAYKVFIVEGAQGGLTYSELTALTYLRVENNPNIGGYALLKAAFEDGAPLTNIRVVGFDYDGDATDAELLASLSNGNYYGINSDGSVNNSILPVLEGTLSVDYIYADDAEELRSNFPNLTLNVSGGYYLRFADAEVQRIVAENWGDGIGTTVEQVEAITDIGTTFRGNTVIETFDEFERFVNVTSIYGNPSGGGAFYGCTALKSIKFQPNINSIGSASFNGCSSLESIGENTSNITTIESSAFFNCTKLSIELNFPNLTGRLGLRAFRNTAITHIRNLGAITSIYSDGNTYPGSFEDCKSLVSAVLPDTLTSIGRYAFYGDTALATINYDWSKLVSLGENAFYNCTALEFDELNLPNLTSLGVNAFYGVKIKKISSLGKLTALPAGTSSYATYGDKSVLEEVVLPDGLTRIPNNSFYAYSTLKSINLDNISEIGISAFYGCKGLSGVLDLRHVTVYGNNCFSECSNIEDIYINQNIESLEVIYRYAPFKYSEDGILSFPNLKTITGAVFQSSKILRVESLGTITNLGGGGYTYVFNDSTIEFCRIPYTCESIGSRVFYAAKSLAEVVCEATTPPSISGDTFYGNTALTAIYVPDESVTAYQEATNWSEYADRIKPLSEYVEE